MIMIRRTKSQPVLLWRCPHCGGTGFSLPRPHDRPEGGACRKSGARSEKEIAIKLRKKFHKQEREADKFVQALR